MDKRKVNTSPRQRLIPIAIRTDGGLKNRNGIILSWGAGEINKPQIENVLPKVITVKEGDATMIHMAS
jgi:hypothetical protein